ncbi:MAG: TonB-dependent receptor, partial [Bdellovibrionia bacterium]
FDSLSSRYINTALAHTEGLELGLRAPVDNRLAFNLTYNYLIAKSDSTGLPLLRRPNHQLSAELAYSVSDQLQTAISGRYVGDRDDVDVVTFKRLRMPPFTILGLTANYKTSDKFKVFGRIDNLLDLTYEEVNGFGTPKRSIYLGVGYTL